MESSKPNDRPAKCLALKWLLNPLVPSIATNFAALWWPEIVEVHCLRILSLCMNPCILLNVSHSNSHNTAFWSVYNNVNFNVQDYNVSRWSIADMADLISWSQIVWLWRIAKSTHPYYFIGSKVAIHCIQTVSQSLTSCSAGFEKILYSLCLWNSLFTTQKSLLSEGSRKLELWQWVSFVNSNVRAAFREDPNRSITNWSVLWIWNWRALLGARARTVIYG